MRSQQQPWGRRSNCEVAGRTARSQDELRVHGSNCEVARWTAMWRQQPRGNGSNRKIAWATMRSRDLKSWGLGICNREAVGADHEVVGALPRSREQPRGRLSNREVAEATTRSLELQPQGRGRCYSSTVRSWELLPWGHGSCYREVTGAQPRGLIATVITCILSYICLEIVYLIYLWIRVYYLKILILLGQLKLSLRRKNRPTLA